MLSKRKQFTLEISQFIHAAHQLPDSDDLITKECSNLHGHTYLVKTRFSSPKNKRNGMVVDFKGIKQIVNILDHQFINQVFEDNDFNEPSTAENIARFLCIKISEQYPDLRDLVILVCEGYKGPDNSSFAVYAS